MKLAQMSAPMIQTKWDVRRARIKPGDPTSWVYPRADLGLEAPSRRWRDRWTDTPRAALDSLGQGGATPRWVSGRIAWSHQTTTAVQLGIRCPEATRDASTVAVMGAGKLKRPAHQADALAGRPAAAGENGHRDEFSGAASFSQHDLNRRRRPAAAPPAEPSG